MSVRKLTPALEQKSKDDLNENPQHLKHNLKHIRKWMKKQPYLNINTDNQWLLSFLRGCKFSLDRTKKKVEMFYRVRSSLPEFFDNRDPLLPEIQEVLKLGLLLPLPNTATPEGPRVIFNRLPPDFTTVSLISIIKVSIMIIDILINEDDNFIISGQHALFDLKNLTFNHIVEITPHVCEKVTLCMKHGYPARPQGFHFINTPVFYESIFKIMKPLMHEKLSNRVNIYRTRDRSNLYKIIPQSIFPKEYGGDNGSLEELTSYWKKKVESYRSWFLEHANVYSNESFQAISKEFDNISVINDYFKRMGIH